ncbi:hypothetical protein GM160_03685 [Guyparkeria halophila]|uniref:PilZ domain-containing protein n=1 Tax=Guyparkeria halophila TaxID=47960 RepID=A0A6I6CUD6_9GAMM|nr:hypothetical protein [Guyparkeria halophila]QGT78066.1 hypothetical protein GM160_03685 [Guyparkeria halophila]
MADSSQPPQSHAVDDLETLLERVPIVGPTEAASLLAGFLGRTDLEEISDEALDGLIARLEPQVERTAKALRRSLRQSPLPMSSQAREQLSALFTLYRAAQSLANLRLGLVEAGDARQARATAHRQRVEWAARLILDCYQLYVGVPQPLYADLHQFARAACRDLESAQPEAWGEVRDVYVAVLLLAMVNPYALTVEEMAVLYPCLREVGRVVEITADRPGGSARFVDMTGRLAPHIAISGGKANPDGAVYVGVDALYRQETIEGLDAECRLALRGFLRRLQFFLNSREARHHDHLERKIGERSLITIGFHSVHHRLLDDMLYSLRASQHLTFSGLDWEGLERPVHGQVKDGPSIHDFKLEIDSGARDDVDWEAMPDANGRPATPRLNEPATWDVVNLSERGLRLHWRLADNSRAAVDELILIERDPMEEVGGLAAVVGVGIIRWVRHLDEGNRTIDMGVERLPGDWMAYFAHPADESPHAAGTWPVLARLEGDRIDQLILPPDLADRGRRVTVIRERGQDVPLNLERIVMVGSHLVVMETSPDKGGNK